MAQTILFRDDMYDGQLARTLSNAYSGLADLGEAFAAARAVKHAEPSAWYSAWHAMAEHTEGLAERIADPVGSASARLRASEYHRQSYFFLRHDIADPRLQNGFRAHVENFAAALPHLGVHAERLAIPYEGLTLKAYLFAPDDSGAARPTILFPAGYDSSAEDGWAYARPALERGYNVVSFEGPGQGASLYTDGLFFRPDFEAVLTPVVDAVIARPDVDPAAVVLVGRSFAGYLAPRGAAYEHRLAALVCDPAQPDMAQHLPQGLLGAVAVPAATVISALSRNQREFFGARMAAHGIHSISDYFDALREFTMLPEAAQIACPTLIVECDDDFAGGGGQLLADALTAPHELVHLTAADGAAGHCAGLGQRVWDGVVYDWLHRTVVPADR